MTDLQLHGPLLLDGQPVTCPGCGMGAALELDRRGPRETWPAWLGCRECGHGDAHPVITNGLVEAALKTRTGRTKAEDRDLFAAQWRDLVLVGEIRPEFVLDDARALAGILAGIGHQQVREHKRAAHRWWRGKKRAARGAAGQAAGAATSTALAAAWDLQTGGAGPAHQSAGRCRVKGCRGGWITITTKIHTDTGRTEKIQQPCGVCHRAN
jgi:hypothetical protein